jgi:hypothetical protein
MFDGLLKASVLYHFVLLDFARRIGLLVAHQSLELVRLLNLLGLCLFASIDFHLGSPQRSILLIPQHNILNLPQPRPIILLIINRNNLNLTIILLCILIMDGQILMSGILIIDLVFCLILVVLLLFAARHEPNRYQAVEDDHYQQV